MVAVKNGDSKIAQALIEKGVDVNVKDWKGFTPLEIAVQNGNKEIVSLLRNAGAKK